MPPNPPPCHRPLEYRAAPLCSEWSGRGLSAFLLPRSAPVLMPRRVTPRLAVLDPAGGGPFAPASSSLRAAACAAGPGQHGRRPGVPAPAAPLPAVQRCRQRRPARLQPAPQPRGDLPHQPGGQRPGCAFGPGPARPGRGGWRQGQGLGGLRSSERGLRGSERGLGRPLRRGCL